MVQPGEDVRAPPTTRQSSAAVVRRRKAAGGGERCGVRDAGRRLTSLPISYDGARAHSICLPIIVTPILDYIILNYSPLLS